MIKVLCLLLALVSVNASGAEVFWTRVGKDYENSAHNKFERTLTKQNVGQIEEKWRIHLETPAGAFWSPAVAGHPAVFNKIVYFGDTLGVVRAVSLETGDIIWSKTLSSNFSSPATIEKFETTPFVTGNAVYITSRHAFCLRRSDGELLWSTPVMNSTDAALIGSDGNRTDFWAFTGDVQVVDNLVIFGVASTQSQMDAAAVEGFPDFTVRGSVVAMDKSSGDVVWRFFTTSFQGVPDPEFGAGAAVWSSPGIDEARHALYIGTGQAYEAPASPLTDSLLAIDYQTGDLLWSYQFTADDVWNWQFNNTGLDWDVSTHPNLFTLVVKLPGDDYEAMHDFVGVGTKEGKYYIFLRDQDPNNVSFVVSVQLDPGSDVGGFQSTPAYDDNGFLYLATHAAFDSEGNRVSIEEVPDPTQWTSKITKIDVVKFLEGEEDFIVWQIIESTFETVPPFIGIRMTFAPLVLANNVLYHASVAGYVHALDPDTGAEIAGSRQIPGPGLLVFDPAFPPLPATIYGAPVVQRGKILTTYGATYNPIFTQGGLVCYGLP